MLVLKQFDVDGYCYLIFCVFHFRICIIAVAPSHPVFKTTVTDISFQVTDDMNRLENKVSGKSKRVSFHM